MSEVIIPSISEIVNIIGNHFYLEDGTDFDFLEMYGRKEIDIPTTEVFSDLKTRFLQNKVLTRKTCLPMQSQIKSVLELLNEPDKETPFLWSDIFAKGEFVGIVGKSGVNKSTFCRQLCLSIATRQTTFCGLILTPSYGRALYCYSEEGENWLRHYIRKNCKGLSYETEALRNMKLLSMETFENGNDLLSCLREEILRQNYDLIVLDSYSDLLSKFGYELNNNDHIRKLKSQLEFLKADGCTVLFNHHTSDKSHSIGSFLGATGFKQIVRAQLEIFENGTKRIVSCEKNSYGVKFEPMVFDLSEYFLFIPTGETMTRGELIEIVSSSVSTETKPAHRPKIANIDIETANAVFGSSKLMTTAQIKSRLHELYPLGGRTASDWVADAFECGLTEKVKHGHYRLKVQDESAASNNVVSALPFCTLPKIAEVSSNNIVTDAGLKVQEESAKSNNVVSALSFCTMPEEQLPENIPSFDVWNDTPLFPSYPNSELL